MYSVYDSLLIYSSLMESVKYRARNGVQKREFKNFSVHKSSSSTACRTIYVSTF
jgi:hypothetical protein